MWCWDGECNVVPLCTRDVQLGWIQELHLVSPGTHMHSYVRNAAVVWQA